MIYCKCKNCRLTISPKKDNQFAPALVVLFILQNGVYDMKIGRQTIFTNYKYIDKTNILEVIQKVFPLHEQNAFEINNLIDYESGDVPAIREKTYRKDIQNFIPDPIANYIVEFKLGFEWGNPITFIQSDDSDSTNDKVDITKAITRLNQCYRAQKIKTKLEELARFIEICGIGYTYVDVNMEWEEGDSLFTLDALDPRCAFVVRSTAYTDKRVVLGVSYRKDDEGNKLITCFTRNERFELKGFDEITLIESNPLGRIPIIEWIRSYDRQGCFERLMPMIDDVTASMSALLDAVQSNTDVIWFSSDVEFPTREVELADGTTKEEVVKPKDGDWLLANTTRDGKQPKVQPLTVDYDYNGQLANINATRAHILKLAHVPQRNDNSGGSTGVAMDDAAGWTDAEADACRKQMLSDSSKMNELEVVLRACKISPFIDSEDPIMGLNYSDCSPNFKRSKTYDLATKMNSICTGLAHGFDLADLVGTVQLFEDSAEVVARSGEGVRKYQETIWKTENEAQGAEGEEAVNGDRLQADLSDQLDNSDTLRMG